MKIDTYDLHTLTTSWEMTSFGGSMAFDATSHAYQTALDGLARRVFRGVVLSARAEHGTGLWYVTLMWRNDGRELACHVEIIDIDHVYTETLNTFLRAVQKMHAELNAQRVASVEATLRCSRCGSPNVTRERRPNGNDTCRACNYTWPSKDKP